MDTELNVEVVLTGLPKGDKMDLIIQKMWDGAS